MKKKTLLCIALFLRYTIPVFAQEDSLVWDNPLSYIQVQDNHMQHLNKAKVTTGVLYDRVFQWGNADNVESEDSVNTERVTQIWHELHQATYDSEGKLSLSEALYRARSNKAADNVISLGAINYQFQTIDSNAFIDSTLYYGPDSLLYEGRDGNPYRTHRIVMPVVFTEDVSDNEVLFYFDPALQLTGNGLSQVSSIKLSIGAQEITLQPGETGLLSFAEFQQNNSFIVLKTEIFLEDGVHKLYYTVLANKLFKTTNIPTASNICTSQEQVITSGSNLMFQGYDENIPTQAVGEIKTYYHLQDLDGTNCDPHIRKPIIILDGFDPLDAERPSPDHIYDLLYYNFKNNHLGAELRLKGFDIIILNFPQYMVPGTGTLRDGGADYMERNAMILVKLIQDINAELASNNSSEKIVIIGPSMGGQISRYALKYMENNGMTHNTRLWVAFDSPNLGANIPLGLQTLVWFGANKANNAAAQNNYNNKLRSYAARQLLIHQSGATTTMTSPLWPNVSFTLPSMNEPMRNQWQTSIDNFGYPSNLRRVALINGTTSSNWHSTCTDIIDYTAKKWANPQKDKLLAQLRAKFYPDYQQSCMIFHGFIHGKSTLSISRYNSSVNGSLDVVPGGLYNTNEIVKNTLDYGKFKAGQLWGIFNVWANGKLESYGGDDHTFIPSVSSLGFYNSNFHWSDDIGNRNLVCTGEIPFHNYFTAATNEDHVFISSDAANWITQEIEKGQPGCPTICSRSIINGANPLCLNSTVTFNLNANVPTGATTTWTVSSGIQIMSSTNNSITVKGASNNPSGFIKATINNPCGANVVIVKDINVGVPGVPVPYISLSSTPNCPKWNITMTFPAVPGSSYTWGAGKVTGCNTNCYVSGTNSGTYTALLIAGQEVMWSTSSTNSCGSQDTGAIYELVVTTNPCNAYLQYVGAPLRQNGNIITAPEEHFAIFPNPSSSDWTISIMSPDIRDMEVTLTDITGRMVYHKTYRGLDLNDIKVPNRELAPATYILRIVSDSRTYTYKIVKE